MSTFVSVIIATHNGASTLPTVLDGYCQQAKEFDAWELIIIDNGSSDATFEIARTYCADLPLTVLQHQTPGKNRALNLGVSKSKGDVLVFSDDDAIPQPGWFTSLLDLAATKPDYDIFGGRVDPKWPSEPPAWIDDIDTGAVYVVTPDDAVSGPTPNGANIWGPIMAVRRTLFSSGARFDECIGPSSDNPDYQMGSETEFIERMCDGGAKCWFSSDWKVWHIIRPHQFDPAWVLARAFRSGRGTFRKGQKTPKLLGNTPRWMVKALLIARFKLVRETLFYKGHGQFVAQFNVNFLQGLIAQARLTYQNSPRKPASP